MHSRPLIRLAVSATVVATLALAGGCSTADPGRGQTQTAMPNFGPAAPDARTAAAIQQIELDYIAAKNSTRTNQHLADKAAAEKKRKEAAAAEAARLAKSKQDEAPPPAPEPPPPDPKP